MFPSERVFIQHSDIRITIHIIVTVQSNLETRGRKFQVWKLLDVKLSWAFLHFLSQR